jgi:hypothetical protein
VCDRAAPDERARVSLASPAFQPARQGPSSPKAAFAAPGDKPLQLRRVHLLELFAASRGGRTAGEIAVPFVVTATILFARR